MNIHFIEEGVKPVTEEALKKALRLPEIDDEDDALIKKLVSDAEKTARPKAVFMRAEIEELGEDYVRVGGQTFTSELVRKNLSRSEFVVAYVGTCGRELYEWAKTYEEDPLAMIACDILQEMYLRNIFKLMYEKIKETYFKEKDMSSMRPGSVDAKWPITEQRPLFSLLGEYADKTGVALNESCLMIPAKSGSGIYFSSDRHFESCMLCTRKNCPNRKAKFEGEA